MFLSCEQSQYSAMVTVMFDPDDSKTLVTCGKEHINFWRLHNTRLERKNGYFEVQLYIKIYILLGKLLFLLVKIWSRKKT